MIGAEQIAAAHLDSCPRDTTADFDEWFREREIDVEAIGEHAIEQANWVVEGTTGIVVPQYLVLVGYFLGFTDGWHLHERTAT